MGNSEGAAKGMTEAFDFTIKRYVAIGETPDGVFRAVVVVATMEDPLMQIPADWWQGVKERWFPYWLKKRFPVRYAQIVAVHKFPELDVPSTLGKEFVHLEIVPAELVGEVERDIEL